MDARLTELLHLLDLERLEVDLFRGESRDIGSPQVFGGQVLGQAVVAATRTVETGRELHSLHAYFLRRGDFNAPRPAYAETNALVAPAPASALATSSPDHTNIRAGTPCPIHAPSTLTPASAYAYSETLTLTVNASFIKSQATGASPTSNTVASCGRDCSTAAGGCRFIAPVKQPFGT